LDREDEKQLGIVMSRMPIGQITVIRTPMLRPTMTMEILRTVILTVTGPILTRTDIPITAIIIMRIGLIIMTGPTLTKIGLIITTGPTPVPDGVIGEMEATAVMSEAQALTATVSAVMLKDIRLMMIGPTIQVEVILTLMVIMWATTTRETLRIPTLILIIRIHRDRIILINPLLYNHRDEITMGPEINRVPVS
jgi:hypothetical protein